MIDLAAISVFEWSAAISGLLYILFAARGSNACWIFLFISAVSIAIVDFYHTHLYFDAVMQLFFALMAVLNICLWNTKADGGSSGALRISTLDIKRNLSYFLVVLAIALPTGYFLQWNLHTAYTFLDSIKALLAIMATFLLIYRILDTWYYWVVVNVISIYLFAVTGAWVVAGLYVVYLIASLRIFAQWYQRYVKQSADPRI